MKGPADPIHAGEERVGLSALPLQFAGVGRDLIEVLVLMAFHRRFQPSGVEEPNGAICES